MHGLINRSLESFLRATYGADLWKRLMLELDLGYDSFEPMFVYDDMVTRQMVTSAALMLDKPHEVLLEDFGTWLVANPDNGMVRRLLRFGGVDYEDFLLSLEDMRGRARLAVPDLDLPSLELFERGGGHYTLDVHGAHEGFGYAFLGLLRAMADEYGALVLLDHEGRRGSIERLTIQVLAADFAEGRDFELAQSRVTA